MSVVRARRTASTEAAEIRSHTRRATWPRAALALALVCAAISVHDHPVLLGVLVCVAVATLSEGRRMANSA
ncbi:MAG TPA: hypothetical protein VGL78_16015, partial [Solirubrobacteraceae bacterium]